MGSQKQFDKMKAERNANDYLVGHVRDKRWAKDIAPAFLICLLASQALECVAFGNLGAINRGRSSFSPPSATQSFSRNLARTAAATSTAKPSGIPIEEELQALPTSKDIKDPAYLDAVSKISRISVPVPETISSTGRAAVSYIHWPAAAVTTKTGAKKAPLPMLLVHGFDSSCLEFRRLGPELAARGIDVYAVDLLGWGFTQLDGGIVNFSADAKVTTLRSFWKSLHEEEGRAGEVRSCVVGGASLGGAAAIEFAAAASPDIGGGESIADGMGNPVKGMVLLDAQGFVDGVGPMAALPSAIAKIGIQVLKSVPLRSSANQMSYHRPEVFATDDALAIGRLHTLRDGWDGAMLSFMSSGGFAPARKVGRCDVPSLVLWGRQDGILDGEEFANRFIEELPNASLTWVEECGHVPHLEQPEMTADVIADFLNSGEFDLWRERGGFGQSLALFGAGAAAVVGAATSLVGS